MCASLQLAACSYLVYVGIPKMLGAEGLSEAILWVSFERSLFTV